MERKPKLLIRRAGGVNILLLLVLLVLFVLALAIGSVDVPLADTVKVLVAKLFGGSVDESLKTTAVIIGDIRLPRVLTAALVGAALASAGCAMQGLLRNPLADGSILGISAGGSLGAVLCILLGSALPGVLGGHGIAVFSIVFSFLSLTIVLSLAYRIDKGFVTNTIILIGVVFTMLVGSITSLLISFSGNKLDQLIFWMMGSLSATRFSNVLWLLPLTVAGVVFLTVRAPELNAFALGEEQAGYLGVNTKTAKLQIMIAVAALVGASVSVSGPIGFVGLISPHIMRLFTGPDHKRLVPSSAVFGAAFLMLADMLSRIVVRPLEISVGIITSLSGSLLFIYLFMSRRRRAE